MWCFKMETLSLESHLPAVGWGRILFPPLHPTRLIFINGLIIMCGKMTGGLCYLETFKAELSLVILCLARQEGLLTLKIVLLNSCPHPLVMCAPINKRCCWRHGHYLLAFIHISPLWPCKSNHPQDWNIFISLALLPLSKKTEYSWLFCSSTASLHVPWCLSVSGQNGI